MQTRTGVYSRLLQEKRAAAQWGEDTLLNTRNQATEEAHTAILLHVQTSTQELLQV